MTVLLSSAYEPGRCLNLRGSVIRLVERRESLATFPGGRGISEWEAEPVEVARYPMTEIELVELAHKTNK